MPTWHKTKAIVHVKKIIIADYEPGIVVPRQFLMERNGYTVMAAGRGEDALDLIYQYKPDLVLLDIMFPGIDGYEVCEIVRLNPDCRDIKIVFLTDRRSEVEIAQGLALNRDEYITKSFSNIKLVALVKKFLENTNEEVRV